DTAALVLGGIVHARNPIIGPGVSLLGGLGQRVLPHVLMARCGVAINQEGTDNLRPVFSCGERARTAAVMAAPPVVEQAWCGAGVVVQVTRELHLGSPAAQVFDGR